MSENSAREYEITSELIERAIELGWDWHPTQHNDDPFLCNPNDISFNWACQSLKRTYQGKTVFVPSYLKRRVEELEFYSKALGESHGSLSLIKESQVQL